MIDELSVNAPIGTDNDKHVGKKEFVLFLTAVFFFTMMTGVVGGYRKDYLINILLLPDDDYAIVNTVCSIVCYALSFFYAIVIDNRRAGKAGKFKPLGLMAAIPCGVLTVLMFVTPNFLLEKRQLLMAYLIVINIMQAAANYFGNTVNMVGVVMSPSAKEREKLLSFRGIASAVGNSAPLVVALVIGLFIKSDAIMYVVSAAVCGVVGSVAMAYGMKVVKERTVYTEERKNPLEGFKDVIKNKYALLVLLSEFLKSFRGIASSMGVFLAAALLGSTSKFLLFGLPTGIGTAVGMLLINFLLKKFNSRTLYICSGVYSVLINVAAFGIGYLYLNNLENAFLQITFLFFLFLIGLQFGASNLLPSMFQADILEDLEVKTGKRLDAGLGFVISTGGTISGAIAGAIFPYLLYGDNSFIGYVQGKDVVQSYETVLWMLFFYTVVHGIMMFLAGVPFFFYKLTGATREKVHEEVLSLRASVAENIGENIEEVAS